MSWMQVLTIALTNIGLFLWLRSESRSDERRALDLIEAIKQDIKDFHGRLCSVESKDRK